MTMYLPDRDPDGSDHGGGDRLEVEATEMSLALIKGEIEDSWMPEIRLFDPFACFCSEKTRGFTVRTRGLQEFSGLCLSPTVGCVMSCCPFLSTAVSIHSCLFFLRHRGEKTKVYNRKFRKFSSQRTEKSKKAIRRRRKDCWMKMPMWNSYAMKSM